MSYALVTGASSGIGYHLARQFAADGIPVILVARSADKLAALAHELERDYGIDAKAWPADLALPKAPQLVYDQVQAWQVQVDYLVNNAGFGLFGRFDQTAWQRELQMINLNITALTHLTKLFGVPMVQRGRGHILNLASTASFFPGPLMAVYYATKNYVLAFSEAIAQEWRETGVGVTALCPGPTESGFQEAAELEASNLVADKKLPTAEEVAWFGYQQMKAGKVVAVHGFNNTLQTMAPRFLPRGMVRQMVHNAQKASE